MRQDVIDFLASLIGFPLASLVAPFYLEMIAIGLIAGSVYTLRATPRELRASYLGAIAAGYVGMLLGGRLIWAWQIPGLTLLQAFFAGGFSTLGAFPGGALFAFVYLRWNRIAFLPFADAMAPGACVALASARIGCFLSGCCYGKVTDSPLGVSYPARTQAWEQHFFSGALGPTDVRSLGTYPTQLFEVALAIILLLLIKAIPTWRAGTKAFLFAGGYAVGRFMIEYFREKSTFGGSAMTFSQVGAIMVFGVAVIFFVWPLLRERVPAYEQQ